LLVSDPQRQPGTGDDTGVGRYREPPTGTPRWVIVSGIIALVVIVLFVVVLLVGGGEHGPGRHSGPPPGVTHTQP
jgi:hypothetical protein